MYLLQRSLFICAKLNYKIYLFSGIRIKWRDFSDTTWPQTHGAWVYKISWHDAAELYRLAIRQARQITADWFCCCCFYLRCSWHTDNGDTQTQRREHNDTQTQTHRQKRTDWHTDIRDTQIHLLRYERTYWYRHKKHYWHKDTEIWWQGKLLTQRKNYTSIGDTFHFEWGKSGNNCTHKDGNLNKKKPPLTQSHRH